MTFIRRIVTGAVLGLAWVVTPLPVAAADAGADSKGEAAEVEATRLPSTPEERMAALEALKHADWAKGGTDTCLACHGKYSGQDLLAVFRTTHGAPDDPRLSGLGRLCESCHGPGEGHAVLRLGRGEQRPPMLNFGEDAWTPVAAQNEVCLECHRSHSRIQWDGSTHAFNDLSCASCHEVHSVHDPVLAQGEQAEVCYQCHQNQRGQFEQISHHPVREGRMACSDCHRPHASSGSDLVVKATLRETCTECHAEKRGPFLWEHAPAAEDCGLCHRPHGSGHPALLKRRTPQLCQECHSQFNHPSVAYDGSFATTSRFVTAKGCLNCHSQVHGSNHPSGVSLAR